MRRLAGSVLGKGGWSVSWALLGQVAAMLASTTNFLLLARLVGPTRYGVIAGAMALVLTVGPIAALGADKLVIRDIAAEPEAAARALTTGLVTIILGAMLAAGVLVALHSVLLPKVPLLLVVALTVAELVANGITSCCAGSLFAAGRARAGGLTMTLASGAKIGAVVLFAVTDGQDPVRWALGYAATTLVAALMAGGWAFLRFGRPALVGYNALDRARKGLPYSANVTATIAQNDLDKTLLVRSGFTREAGQYSVAYRLATMAWLPVLAVLQVTLPRFFKLGEDGGLAATNSFARRLIRPLLAYAVFAGIVLVLAAPAIPFLVGEEYRDAVPLLLLLAPLPLIKVVQYVPSDALTGAGHQSVRMKCILLSTALNVGMNVALIPRYGLSAALLATFVAEVVYGVSINASLRRRMAKVATSDVEK